MRNSTFLLLITICFLYSCSTKKVVRFNPYKKYSPEQLNTDYTLLQNVLEKEHPSLYWHSTKAEMDSVFAVNRKKLNDSLTEFQFRHIVGNVLSNIKCGHTSVRNTQKFENWIATANLNYFPFGMRLFADTLMSTYSLYRKDTLLPRGSIIKSINGKPAKEIVKNMYAITTTDGNSNNFKNLRISNNFPYYYLSVYDSAKQYTIVYNDTNSIEQTVTVTSFKRPPPDTTKKSRLEIIKHVRMRLPKPTKEQKRSIIRSLRVDTTNSTAILYIQSFSKGRQKKFYKETFKKLKELNIKSLVIDVRNNGGGLISNSTMLARYIVDKPFHVADSVYATHRFSKFNKYIKYKFWYGLSMLFVTKQKQDGNYHFNWFTRKKIKPIKKNHFNNQVYIITGGYSFSATTLFINYTYKQTNVTTVGEPTGGSGYGNTAVYIPNLTLPNTKLKVRMPVFRLVLNKDAVKGAPLYPEVYVSPTVKSIRTAADNKMEKVYELIKMSNR